MLRRLSLLLPVLLAATLPAQEPVPAPVSAPAARAPRADGAVVVVVRSHAPVHRHVGARTVRYVVPATAAARGAPPREARPAANLRHLKGR